VPPLRITSIRPTPRFRKAYKRLDPVIKEDVDRALEDLLRDPVPNGRRLPKMEGHRNPEVWKIRITRNFRLTFELREGVAVLRNVGSHNMIRDP
jgi:mRNA-degrading endonuclease RelE of RelBE toxin-antitoxin system